MARDYNILLANLILDYIYDTHFPAGSTFTVYGAAVTGAENAQPGTQLAVMTLPASPWAAAAGGSKAKQGVWQDLAADNGGTMASYRLVNAAGTRIEEGTITVTGGGGDFTTDSVGVTAGQSVTLNTLVRTA